MVYEIKFCCSSSSFQDSLFKPGMILMDIQIAITKHGMPITSSRIAIIIAPVLKSRQQQHFVSAHILPIGNSKTYQQGFSQIEKAVKYIHLSICYCRFNLNLPICFKFSWKCYLHLLNIKVYLQIYVLELKCIIYHLASVC